MEATSRDWLRLELKSEELIGAEDYPLAALRARRSVGLVAVAGTVVHLLLHCKLPVVGITPH